MHSKETVFLPKEERTDKPSSLFFLYCAANIGILGLVYGAIIVGFHLSFSKQSLRQCSAPSPSPSSAS